ncbi:hypothetical protein [uncultured Microbacterium sp.]|uniref:hypothetical protein n=1 Tax=uncultured Microbacterium sp. TaxID=191216 RepID=UPI0035CA90DE
MSNERDLPEGVIDADPPGGWESEEVADRETAAANADAIDSPSLTESGLPPLTPDGTDATADAPADGSVEGAALSSGTDPDLRTDADVDEAS